MGSNTPVVMPLPPIGKPTNAQPRILLFGDSHSHAVHLAVERRLGDRRQVPLAVFRQLKEKNGRKVGNITFDGFLKRISQLKQTDVVLSLMGGSRHAAYSTTQHPQPFDFFSRGRGPAVAAEVEIIPYRALQVFFAEGIYEHVGRRLKKLRSTTEARVVHIIPPPPKRDNAYIARYHEKFYAAQGLEVQGVSPPELRLKFWMLQTRVLQKLCGKLGVEIMLPPPLTIKGGFLRAEYFAQDTTHANELYGELVLEQVEKEFYSRSLPPDAMPSPFALA